jgi:hypothetical protein
LGFTILFLNLTEDPSVEHFAHSKCDLVKGYNLEFVGIFSQAPLSAGKGWKDLRGTVGT